MRLFLVRHLGGGAFVFSGYKGRVWFAGFQIHWFPSGLDHCWENEGLNGGRPDEPNKKRKSDSMHWVWQGNLVPSLPPELSQQLHAKGHPPDGTVKDTWGWGFALCNECLAGIIVLERWCP